MTARALLLLTSLVALAAGCSDALAQGIPGDIECPSIGGDCSAIATHRAPSTGAVPVFDTGDPETATWGVPTDAPVAGMTLLFQAVGSDVTSGGTGTWATTGSLATTLTGTGDATPTLGGASLVPDTDYFDPEGNLYQAGSAPGVALGTMDLVTVALTRVPASGTAIYLSNHDGGAARAGVEAFSQANGSFSCSVASDSLSDTTDIAASGLDAETHALHVCVIDRSAYMESYVNATGSGSPADISAGAGENLHNGTDAFTLAGRATGGVGQQTGLSFVQVWGCDGCLTTTSGGGDYDTEMAELYAKVNGSHLGTGGTPTTATRASHAYLRVCDPTDNVVRYEYVGDNWPRREVSCGYTWDDPTNSETTIGSFFQESAVTNIADFGNLLDNAAWTTINASVDADQQDDPAGGATLDDIDGSGTGEHGVSQAQTLTVAAYTFSSVFKPGNQTFAYMDVSSLTDVSAYFDSSDCQPDTTGANVTAAYGFDLGDLCYVHLIYTGTATSHTHRLLCAEADADKDYAGAAGDCAFGWVGIAQNDSVHSPVLTGDATDVARSADALRYNLPSTLGLPLTLLADIRVGPPGTGTFVMLHEDATPPGDRVNIIRSSNNVVHQYRFGGSLNGPNAIAVAGRHILRAHHDGSSVYLAVDGVEETPTALSATPPYALNYLCVGHDCRTGATDQSGAPIYRLRVYPASIATGEQGTGDDTP